MAITNVTGHLVFTSLAIGWTGIAIFGFLVSLFGLKRLNYDDASMGKCYRETTFRTHRG